MKDIYLYENSNVLKNKLNIQNKEKLEKIEADCISYRILELESLNIDKKMGLEYFRQIHFNLFQDIYEWAGEFRTIDIEKYEQVLNGLSVKYIEFSKVEDELNRIFAYIKTKDIAKMNIEELVDYITDITKDIWKVHCFRERKYKNHNTVYI